MTVKKAPRWQTKLCGGLSKVPVSTSLPAGLHIKIDMQTGAKLARLIPPDQVVGFVPTIQARRERIWRLIWAAEAKSYPTFSCTTTASSIAVVFELRFDWAENGAMRLLELLEAGELDRNIFYRVTESVAQFGIAPRLQRSQSLRRPIPDDRAAVWPERGDIFFATAGKAARTTHLQVVKEPLTMQTSTAANAEPVVATVLAGMEVIDRLTRVGESPPTGSGPSPESIVRDPSFVTQFPGKYLTEHHWGRGQIDWWVRCTRI